jgi:hypothetical protein
MYFVETKSKIKVMNIPVNFEKELTKTKVLISGITYRMEVYGNQPDKHPIGVWLIPRGIMIPQRWHKNESDMDMAIYFTIPFGINWGGSAVNVKTLWAKAGTGDHWLGGTDTQIVIGRDNLMTRNAFIFWLERVVPIVKNLM